MSLHESAKRVEPRLCSACKSEMLRAKLIREYLQLVREMQLATASGHLHDDRMNWVLARLRELRHAPAVADYVRNGSVAVGD